MEGGKNEDKNGDDLDLYKSSKPTLGEILRKLKQ